MNIIPIRAPWGGTMTGRERFNRQMNYQSVDRSFNMEFGYWEENFTEWDIFRDNGIRDNAQADRFFSFDRIEGTGPSFGGWMHPSFERRVVEGRGVKVIIGGAPITQAYADEIGAFGYSEDANGAVKLADAIFGRK